MTILLLSLLAFVAWTLIVLSGLLSWRGVLISRGDRRIEQFPSGEKHGSDTYWRLNRAHQNCVENLPLFAAVVIAGVSLGEQTLRTLPLALFAAKSVPVARVLQSLAHVSAGSAAAVTVRFSAFFLQLVAISVMAASFAGVLL